MDLWGKARGTLRWGELAKGELLGQFGCAKLQVEEPPGAEGLAFPLGGSGTKCPGASLFNWKQFTFEL